VFAQSNVWTKDDRTNIYNDCLSYITKYVGLTSEQRKTISKCYLENITKKYDKQSYQNLIDVEIQDLRESTLSLCAKSSGVELSEQKKVEPKIEPPLEVGNKELPATKENLIGHWTDDNSDFWLFETGDYKMQYNDGKSARGTWKIENNQLTLNKEKFLGKSEKSFKILLFTKNKFVYQSMSKKAETLTATKTN
jgi:hypothetical protein